MQIGKASLKFEEAPLILSAASVAGKMEGEGPIGGMIDKIEMDPMFGKDSWEEAESEIQKETAELVIQKAGLEKEDIRYLYAGDLLSQLIATSFGLADLQIPIFGLYGACSTMGEAMGLAAMSVNAGYADHTIALASSHFASAERQFRFPLAYGNQRPYSATWTVTGSGGVVIAKDDKGEKREKSLAKITGATTGKIVDIGSRDSMNMGAAMAPAAVDTILQNFKDFERDENYYDKIITGDLGTVGQKILFDFMKEKGHDLSQKHIDCGITIFDSQKQDTHAGGSGCGCSAVTLCAYILPNIKNGTWKRVLFLPTGALLSPTSFNEGQSVPGIAHAVVIESV